MTSPAISALLALIELDLQESWAALDAEHFVEAKAALLRAGEKIDQIAILRKCQEAAPPDRQLTINIR